MSGQAARAGLGYSFTPIPERATMALRSGDLSPNDYALLAVLYERANVGRLVRREQTPTLSLAQLAEAIGHSGTQDALSKRLRRLADKPEQWLSWTLEGRHRYAFVLHPDGPKSLSESRPSSTDGSRPRLSNQEPAITSRVFGHARPECVRDIDRLRRRRAAEYGRHMAEFANPRDRLG